MPTKKYKNPKSAKLLLISSTVGLTILIGGILSQPTSNSTPHVDAKTIISPVPTNFPNIPGMTIDPYTISISDKYNDLILREIKPTNGTTIDRNTNLTIVFQGRMDITGIFDDQSCFWPDTASVSLLPRFPNTNPEFPICFSNPKKILAPTATHITLEDFTVIKEGRAHLYLATFIKAN